MKRWRAILGVALVAIPLALLGARWRQRGPATVVKASTPTTTIKRGDVVFTVTARGELQGGNSEMLTTPMTGGNEMPITFLRKPGELVNAGDVVAELDTTEQTFNLREAEADLAEAEQQVVQAQAESQAKEEEAKYLLLQAKADLRLAELEARKNPLVAAIIARQNELALEAARDRVTQIESDLGNRRATTEAGVAIQEAARNKAKVKAETARKNIESMTLRAKSSGYVAIQQNVNSNFMYPGMRLPMLQVGDTVRAGMAVAQIPDLKSWEASARIGELDRGHLAVDQKAEFRLVAMPGRQFTGRVKNLGSTAGPPWDRHFDCRLTLDDPSPELRQGMTANVVITTEVRRNVLWAPAQALFESDGRTY
ncbi:MAG: HlyD family efflux transporter periplasmic adaptor subunit, partial [Acidobacteria bacterium]|nr:HlyD family efflux transporter periplasmic adaptor subunit [Acidobacteriota bacterium]